MEKSVSDNIKCNTASENNEKRNVNVQLDILISLTDEMKQKYVRNVEPKKIRVVNYQRHNRKHWRWASRIELRDTFIFSSSKLRTEILTERHGKKNHSLSGTEMTKNTIRTSQKYSVCQVLKWNRKYETDVAKKSLSGNEMTKPNAIGRREKNEKCFYFILSETETGENMTLWYEWREKKVHVQFVRDWNKSVQNIRYKHLKKHSEFVGDWVQQGVEKE